MTGAPAQKPGKAERSHGAPASAQAVSTAAQSRSCSVSSSDEEPCGCTAGPRLKRASGPLQRNQLLRLKRSAGARLHSAEHETANRIAPVGISRARTHGLAKNRAHKRSVLRLQVSLCNFLGFERMLCLACHSERSRLQATPTDNHQSLKGSNSFSPVIATANRRSVSSTRLCQ